MSDDDSLVGPKLSGREHDPDLLLYDYSKYLLTLSLLVLGGVLSLTQGADAAKVKGAQLVVVIASLGLSGLLSLSCANNVVRQQTEGRARSPWPKRLNQAAMFFLGSGVAAFLTVWLDALR